MSHVKHIKDVLQQLKPFLADKYYVSSIGLFGSIVRDDYSPASSDIDIIVDFSKPIGIEFIDLADYIEKALDKKVDLVSKKGIKSKYFAQIEPEIIYV
ncbi:nucleotidyltransferase family protein [Longitalea arenae]|uniref:nucleotidyltransferase family protein n=1 Tax=Longitalea arenae TaxID=2812558 RepID=UPI0019677023|nr:nucleotidyltransferase family protein [Longitalea arenae]